MLLFQDHKSIKMNGLQYLKTSSFLSTNLIKYVYFL